MRHRSKTAKLQRDAAHRRSLLANLTCSLIEHGRIRTTLAKAKALRPVAEKMVTFGKRGDLHARRQAIAFLRQKEHVKHLFGAIAAANADRPGGYCRITKLGARTSDAAPMAYIEWVEAEAIAAASAPQSEEPVAEAAASEE
ncbi:50S ribosomal protein L17 [Persicirhabdus sediminis]|uniref:Large ribosomal subunit protein bL17 n=1 Tax=Persicirhabdus sediminis TaxID=454144 RepID=A0A8J7SNT2_9BACT|nr:50S ribosomal protein L17 [Persicirhabdus sediminis]MBK1791883.1 50S ribosomal protein L17 [Persicirhabdus sediminis]